MTNVLLNLKDETDINPKKLYDLSQLATVHKITQHKEFFSVYQYKYYKASYKAADKWYKGYRT